MQKTIKKYFPVFALPTLVAFLSHFCFHFLSDVTCLSVNLRQ